MKRDENKTYSLAVCGLMTALAMILSYVEFLIPIPLPIPGIKLGFANIAIIVILYIYGQKQMIAVNIIRVILVSILFGNITAFIFSMSGAILAMLLMIILKRCKAFSIRGVSCAGAVMHNLGQILAAAFVMGTSAIIYYLPILIIAGLVCGLITGLLASIVVDRMSGLNSNDGQ